MGQIVKYKQGRPVKNHGTNGRIILKWDSTGVVGRQKLICLLQDKYQWQALVK
jgi:hypothetical protein